MGSSVPISPHLRAQGLSAAMKEPGLGLFCSPEKELGWLQVLIPWQGKGDAGWPQRSSEDEQQPCSLVCFAYAADLGRWERSGGWQ